MSISAFLCLQPETSTGIVLSSPDDEPPGETERPMSGKITKSELDQAEAKMRACPNDWNCWRYYAILDAYLAQSK